MSHRKSPPASPFVPSAAETASLRILDSESMSQKYDSTPDLSQIPFNAAERKKRKIGGEEVLNPGDLTSSIFSEFVKAQEARYEKLLLKLEDIIEQNNELKRGVEVMSSKHDEFLKRISSLESERKDDKKIIKQLEEKIENLERKSRATGLELRNIPKRNGETKNQLCELMVNMGKSLDTDIKLSDIKDVYRIKSKENTQPVVMELNTVILKEKILQEVRDFNKTKNKGEKLNTTHLKLPSPVQPIFVSETLTHKTQRLYFLARQFQKGHGYSFCWTSHGIVYLRKTANDGQTRINSEADLEKLRNNISA